MNDNENLVLEGTENVEATATEEIVEQVAEPEKVYTEEEFNTRLNEAAGKRASRKEAKLRKEYDRKYGRLVDVLRAGTGVDDVEEITNKLSEFYEGNGVEIPKEPRYSNKEIEILARADVEEIISGGFEDAVEEADRLNEIGFENMSARDKAVFVALTEYINNTETSKALSQLGVTEDVANSKEFKDFASKFSSKTPITEIYEIFTKTQPKPNIKPMGSIKNNLAKDDGVKDFYSYEEALQFTVEDFNNNPALYKSVLNSMPKW